MNGKKKITQISESLPLGLLLALSGGLMDAYSYVCRGKVFANAQTGNILLFAVNLSERNYLTAMRYFFPVLAFVAGIALAANVRHFFREARKLHWRQTSVMFEMVLLFFVSFLPQSRNLLANCLTSFACGIQVEAFRKIEGTALATTMCIGNLRTATQSLCEWIYARDRENAKKVLLAYGMIGVFAVGAVLGNGCVARWNEGAIRVSCLILLSVFLLMFLEHRRENRQK